MDKSREPSKSFTTSWIVKARRYLALRNEVYIKDAIAQAEKDGLKGVSDILKALKNQNFQDIRKHTPILYKSLIKDEREEEARTVLLIFFDLQAQVYKIDGKIPSKIQSDNQKTSLAASFHALEIAHQLRDQACKGFYFRFVANALHEQAQVNRAKKAYTEAIDIYKKLTEKHPQTYEPWMAITLYNRGNVFFELNRLEEAKKDYAEAIDIYRELTEKNPKTYEPLLADALNNHGTVLRNLNQLKEAEQKYAEALVIRKKTAKENRETYEPKLANTFYNRGNLFLILKRLEEAKKDFTGSLAIYRMLAKKDRETYEPQLAAIFYSLGNLFLKLNELKKAEKEYNNAVAIYRKLTERIRKAREPEIAAALKNLGYVLQELNRMKEAKKAYAEALAIYRKLTKKNRETYEPLLADTLNNLGTVFLKLNRIEEAKNNLTEALAIYRTLAKKNRETYEPKMAVTLNDLGTVLRNLKMLEKADKAYAEALDIQRKLAEKNPKAYKPLLASTLNNRGNVLRDLNRPEEAEKAYTDALAIAEENREELEPEIAATLKNLGNLLHVVHRQKEADKAYSEALDIYRKLTEKNRKTYEPPLANTLNDRGNVLRDLNRLEEAEQAHTEALDIYRKLTEKNRKTYEPPLANTLNNRGNVLHDQKRLEEAKNDLAGALTIYRKLSEKDRETYEPKLGTALNNLGYLLHNLNRPDEARKAYTEALDIQRKLTEKNPKAYEPQLAKTLNNLGNFFLKLNRPKEAENSYIEALDIFRTLAKKKRKTYGLQLAKTLNNIGNFFLKLNRLEETKICFKEAIEINRRIAKNHRTIEPFRNLGRLLNRTGQYSNALQYLKEAVEIVEQRRSLAIGLDRRMQVLRDNAFLYEQLLICLMKLERFPEALEIAERGKSRSLVDLLSLSDLMPNNIPSELGQQYKNALVRARMLNERLHRSNDPFLGRVELLPYKTGVWQEKQIQLDRHDLVELHEELIELEKKIREYDPDFLPYAKPLNLHEIKELAKQSQTSLVLFRVTSQGGFVFFVFPDGETDAIEIKDFTSSRLREMLVKLDDSDNLVDGWLHHYRNYRQLSRTKERENRWFEVIERVTGELYKELLKHVHERLNIKLGKDGRKHKIVLVPNRDLAILPLHACWWEQNGKKKYLFDKFTVSYAPSLTVYKRCIEREKEGRAKDDSLVGIANPNPPGDLAFSEWLCTEIVRMFGENNCRMLWRDEATKQELLKRLGPNKWTHFSCHGEYRMDQPMQSTISLAGKNEKDKLTLGEIFEQVNLPKSWLVVLSACETGLVDFTEIADEHYGLPIGFIYAGAPTVWSTLWTVNDNPTAILMIKAYDELLRNHKSKAEALIAAQKWLRDANRDEIINFVEQRGKDVGNGDVLLPQLESFLRELRKKFNKSDQPFHRPPFWAGMQCVGV
jgi:tetratricopeptide (TPR) repeat protein